MNTITATDNKPVLNNITSLFCIPLKIYTAGIETDNRFVVIDEAFGRGSDESTRYGLELFRKLNLQLLIVTPLQKLHIIEGHVNSFHFVSNKDGNNSQVSNFTKEEYELEKAKHDSLFNRVSSKSL